MKIIIFGATGGIGHHAVRHALEKGYEVVAYVRSPQKMTMEHPQLTIAKGVLTDYEAMRDAMRGCDAVVWTVGVSMDGTTRVCHRSTDISCLSKP